MKEPMIALLYLALFFSLVRMWRRGPQHWWWMLAACALAFIIGFAVRS